MLRWLIRSYDAIPIERDGLGMGGLKESLRRLKRGEMVLIFPEGRRTGDGEVAPLRPGFTMLAIRSGAAILPVGIDGAYAAWPRQRKYPGRGRICIHYGPPITADEVQGRSEEETHGGSQPADSRVSRHRAPRLAGQAVGFGFPAWRNVRTSGLGLAQK